MKITYNLTPICIHEDGGHPMIELGVDQETLSPDHDDDCLVLQYGCAGDKGCGNVVHIYLGQVRA